MYILDFDGTIVDIWERYYSVFNDYWKIEELNKTLYIDLKKTHGKDDLIVKEFFEDIHEEDLLDYQRFKKICLEAEEYLRKDRLLVDISKLKSFFEKKEVIVLTVRRDKQMYFNMLENFGIGFLNSRSVVLFPSGIHVKKRWVNLNINCAEKITVVGDSETDASIGIGRKIDFCFVNTGLGNFDKLRQICGDAVYYNSLFQFMENQPGYSSE